MEAYQYGDAYYIFVMENGPFCISTNSAELFNKGKIRVLSKLNEKHRNNLHVDNYKLFKTVPFIGQCTKLK